MLDKCLAQYWALHKALIKNYFIIIRSVSSMSSAIEL